MVRYFWLAVVAVKVKNGRQKFCWTAEARIRKKVVRRIITHWTFKNLKGAIWKTTVADEVAISCSIAGSAINSSIIPE